MRLALVLVFLAAVPAAAQNSERLPWFVVDAHVGLLGLPQAEGWVPAIPGGSVTTTTGTTTTTTSTVQYPGRNWGAAGGITVYPLKLGLFTFGVGVSLSTAKGTAETQEITGTGDAQTTRVTHVVHTAITNLTPQISLNFGRRLGWSYLSAGIGQSRVGSRADAIGTTPEIVVPDSWNQALNFGGGARWFMKPRLGAGFDVRFVKLSSRSPTATLPSARRTQMWNVTAGISIQ